MQLIARTVAFKEAVMVKGDDEAVSRMLDEWDPIGVYVAGDGPPAGEYQRLVGPVLSMLRSGKSAEEIAVYLTSDVHANMGLPSRAGADLEAATRMHTWFHDPDR